MPQYAITFVTDASMKHQKYAVCDQDCVPVRVGFFPKKINNQGKCEKEAIVEAIQCAYGVKIYLGLAELRLDCFTDVKGFCEGFYIHRRQNVANWLHDFAYMGYGIDLYTHYIQGGKANPADKWSRIADCVAKRPQALIERVHLYDGDLDTDKILAHIHEAHQWNKTGKPYTRNLALIQSLVKL